jgi:ABC-2 type transport system ATP-binding protein
VDLTAPVIAARRLRKEFGRKVAVAELSLDVHAGEVFGFLGPNGAGKTTSLKMMLGLIAPTSGGATLLGAPIGDRPTRARIGFLPEHFRFQEWLTGREMLRLHGRLYGMRGPGLAARVETLLERVDLVDAGEEKLRNYSKGMLQRVGLAQAVLNEPALVFLDEPTSGLDPLGRLLVRDLIRELRAAGTTVFLNSHLLGEVEATCDRVVFVKQGRTVHEVRLGAAATDLMVHLELGETGPELIEGIARFGDVTSVDGRRVTLRAASESVLPELSRWIVGRGVDLYRLDASRPSLEQLFVQVMGDDQRPG